MGLGSCYCNRDKIRGVSAFGTSELLLLLKCDKEKEPAAATTLNIPGKLDQIRSDQIRSDQIRSDQIRQIRSDRGGPTKKKRSTPHYDTHFRDPDRGGGI